MKIFLFYTFLLLGWPIGKGPVKTDHSFTAKVVKIVDGDTFDVLTEGKNLIRIRMNGIDCPERRQDYYQVCKDALADYIFGKNVQLKTYEKDRYQRTIADVFYQDQNINLMMIRNGFAWHYKKYSSDVEMAKAQEKACAEGIGLWKIKHPVAPWNFRKQNKKKSRTNSKYKL